jgi:uncharacterized protein
MRCTLLAFSLSAAMLCCLDAEAQTPSPSQAPSRATLTVQGDGRSEAKPDYARLTIDLLAKAPTIEGAVEASKTLVPRVDALLQSVKSEGVQVESSRFDLSETPPPRPTSSIPPPSAPPSYTATTSYNLKIDKIDHLNSVIGKLASSGLVEMRTASFHVGDERIALDEARRDAVADARRQAELLADAAGVRLDDIASISDARAAPAGLVQYDLPTRKYLQVIPPAKLDFTASIVMSWHISPRP